ISIKLLYGNFLFGLIDVLLDEFKSIFHDLLLNRPFYNNCLASEITGETIPYSLKSFFDEKQVYTLIGRILCWIWCFLLTLGALFCFWLSSGLSWRSARAPALNPI